MTPQTMTFLTWHMDHGADRPAGILYGCNAWAAAQTQLATSLIPQPGGTLLTVAEIYAECHRASDESAEGFDGLDVQLSRRIEAAVLQKQRDLFAASLTLPAGPGDAP